MSRLLLPHEADLKNSREAAKLVDEEVKLRNDVAHGDWYIGWISAPGDAEPQQLVPHWVERIKARRKEGPLVPISEDLETRSEEVEQLTEFLREYGLVCFRMHGRRLAGQSLRVRDVVCLKDGQPAFGPKALHWP